MERSVGAQSSNRLHNLDPVQKPFGNELDNIFNLLISNKKLKKTKRSYLMANKNIPHEKNRLQIEHTQAHMQKKIYSNYSFRSPKLGLNRRPAVESRVNARFKKRDFRAHLYGLC